MWENMRYAVHSLLKNAAISEIWGNHIKLTCVESGGHLVNRYEQNYRVGLTAGRVVSVLCNSVYICTAYIHLDRLPVHRQLSINQQPDELQRAGETTAARR